MRYAAIRSFDVTNGQGNGVSLFVQGCPFHCKGCFNPETWDFDGGKEWTNKTEEMFLELVGRDYIRRVSFLGGEPLCNENITKVLDIIKKIKIRYPDKKIWVYTGSKFEDIILSAEYLNDEITISRYNLLSFIDILVDGPFEYDKRDLTLAFRGSTNQRIINVKETLKKLEDTEEIVLWNNETD